MAAQGEIPVYGKFVNETTNHVLAGTDQIKDDTLNKMQSTINAEVQTALNGKASAADIVAAKNELLDLIYAAL